MFGSVPSKNRHKTVFGGVQKQGGGGRKKLQMFRVCSSGIHLFHNNLCNFVTSPSVDVNNK